MNILVKVMVLVTFSKEILTITIISALKTATALVTMNDQCHKFLNATEFPLIET